jgi:hypothetical protein
LIRTTMANSRLSFAPFTLALAASLACPQAASAFNIVYNGTNYDLSIYTGSYNANPAYFAPTTTSNGRMPWWGNEALAQQLADQLRGGLSPQGASFGPLFATEVAGDVSASFFDLSSLGTTNVVDSGTFARDSVESYVVVSSVPVPAPLPVLATAVCFSVTRRLQNLSSRLRAGRFKK